MKYKYIKRVYNHDKTALKIDNTYTIEKDNRFTDSYIIKNLGLIINSYTLEKCFEEVK
jgi:hypothetical protein